MMSKTFRRHDGGTTGRDSPNDTSESKQALSGPTGISSSYKPVIAVRYAWISGICWA